MFVSPEMLSAVAACLSFLAVCGSVLATWFGPQSAAKLAEAMRREAQDHDEKHRMRYWIFSTIMSDRITYYNPDAVKAFNLIDVAFIDNFDVRQAWAGFFETLDPNKRATDLEKKQRLRVMLQQMSKALGLEGRMTVDDFERIYYPTAIAEMHRLQYLQRQAMLKEAEGAEATNTIR